MYYWIRKIYKYAYKYRYASGGYIDTVLAILHKGP
jgi:hypothetical protein